jgi:flagellar export protein FliJ
MKAYRFRLATVVRVRELQERAAAQRLGDTMRSLHAARNEHARACATLARLPALQGSATPAELHWIHDQADRMSATVQREGERVRAASAEAVEARRTWELAEQRCTVLERLDDRQHAKWQADLDRSDATELDDLAAVRFARGRAGR